MKSTIWPFILFSILQLPFMLSACLRRGVAQPSCRVRRSWIQQRPLASLATQATFHPGQKLHGFTVESLERFPELDVEAVKLRHKTGAEYIHLIRDDPNNVFMIGFKTNPPDRTGVPHILEHTTLCGSEKYPVRDPFFKMISRSFSPQMNAMTYSDHTQYPFDTTHRQDYKNLMSVYLDATLNPLLQENDFRQEGWRIGPKDSSSTLQDTDVNATNPLEFKGVVYNEMKGVRSEASSLFYTNYALHLIPGLHDSGGDPHYMTDLTWEQLRKFHADHYHPSNAKLFTYGDGSLEENAQLISSYLDKFEASKANGVIVQPIDLSNGPHEVTVDGPLDAMNPPDKQFRTTTTWQVCNIDNIVERFSMQVINNLLTAGFGSPIYQALIESGLATNYSPVDGINSVGTKCILSIGASGVRKEDVRRVKEVIYETLSEVSQKGFNKIKVDGVLHQLEIGLKDRSAMFGTELKEAVVPDWFSGVDPFNSLRLQRTIDEFRERYSKPRYLEDLIADRLLNNRTLTFTMRPAEDYNTQLAEKEASRLAKKLDELNQKFSSEQKVREHLTNQELALVKEQIKKQDLSVLPTLGVKDIERIKQIKKVTHSKVGNVSVQWRETPTNGITYFQAINVFKNLPEELVELIPLFTICIHRLGTKDMTMERLEEQIKANLGSLSVTHHSTTSTSDLRTFEQGLSFSGWALDRNVPAIYDLLKKLVLETDFDSPQAEAKIREMLMIIAMHTPDAILTSGNTYAVRYAASMLTPESAVAERTKGLLQAKLIFSLARQKSLDDIIRKLKTIQQLALSNAGTLRASIICGSESRKENEALLSSEFLSNLPTFALELQSSKVPRRTSTKTFIQMPSFQVSYVGLALPGIPYTQPESAALTILSQLLTHQYLHTEIRERGGAYGAGAFANGLGGIFSMASYRDPNPRNTLDVLRTANDWVQERNFTESDIEESKISIFKQLDAPESVSQEGLLYFQTPITPDLAQKRREWLLDVTEEQIKAAAQKFLGDMKNAQEVVIGPQHPFEKELGWRVVKNLALDL